MSLIINWTYWVGHLRTGGFYHIPLLIGILGYFIYKVKERSSLGLLDIYFLVAFGVFLAFVGKIGASYHYMLEFVVVGCILVGILLCRILLYFRDRYVPVPRLLIGGLLIVLVILQPLGFPLGQGLRSYEYQDTTENAYGEVLDYIRNSGSAIFCSTCIYPMLAEQAEIKVEWQPFDSATLYIGKLHQVEGKFGWDQTEVLHRLDTGYYKLVILEYDLEEVWTSGPGSSLWEGLFNERLSVEVGKAILDNYELVHTTDWIGTVQCYWKTYIYEYSGG